MMLLRARAVICLSAALFSYAHPAQLARNIRCGTEYLRSATSYAADRAVVADESEETNSAVSDADKSETEETEDVSETAEAEILTINETEVKIDHADKEEVSYTERDLYCLSVVICREAAGQSEEIKLLVGNVVLNRVASKYYPNTIEKVLTQYKQYGSMWKTGVKFPDWATDERIAECRALAKRLLDGERFCPENVLYQAEFEQGTGIYKHFEGFYFCFK